MDVADEFLELVKESGHENLQDVVAAAKAIKGLAELVKGNIESGRETSLNLSSMCFYSTVRLCIV